MALSTSDILLTDQISILRTSFNSLKAEFNDFTFDPYTDALTLDNDLTLTGSLSIETNATVDGDLTIDGEAYFDGTYLMLNWGNSSITTGGLRVDRGSAGNDAVLRFDESDDLWKVGLFGGSFTALSLVGHTHDDRYYTESEIDSLISGYYTSSQVDTLLTDYYTSLEIDAAFFAIPSTVVGTGYKVYTHNASLNDDATVTLPAITTAAFGWVVVGDNAERSFFFITSTGAVTLVSNSTNVVANADTDNKFCLGTASPQEPLTVRNRLGGARTVMLVLWYD